MTAYFNDLEREIHELSDEARKINGGDTDFFLDQLGRIEESLARIVTLNSGDREFPEDLREKVVGAIAVHATRAVNGSGLGVEFYSKARRTALATRRSRLVSEIHAVFHELAARQIRTRFGLWADDPKANLHDRELHDQGALGNLGCGRCQCEKNPETWLGPGRWFLEKPALHAPGCTAGPSATLYSNPSLDSLGALLAGILEAALGGGMSQHRARVIHGEIMAGLRGRTQEVHADLLRDIAKHWGVKVTIAREP